MLNPQHQWNISFTPVIVGFCASLLLTLATFYTISPLMILGLATLQALLQLIFFFQLGIESKPRWNLMLFLFMALIMAVVIGGSLWIMYSLDYNVMPQ